MLFAIFGLVYQYVLYQVGSNTNCPYDNMYLLKDNSVYWSTNQYVRRDHPLYVLVDHYAIPIRQ